jgi:hypothetical protein
VSEYKYPTIGEVALKATLAERERIIKLLEDECEGDWPKVIEISLDVLIALIKGGNK